MNVPENRRSTADTTLHSVNPDILSARGPGNMSTFSMETTQGQIFAPRQSSVYSVTSYHAQQPQHQRIASGMHYLRQEFVDKNDCIPEERESNPSPNQYDTSEIECGRESLAERPGMEGSVQSPIMMPVSTPFSAQSNPRQIPISNCSTTSIMEKQQRDEQQPNAQLISQMGRL